MQLCGYALKRQACQRPGLTSLHEVTQTLVNKQVQASHFDSSCHGSWELGVRNCAAASTPSRGTASLFVFFLQRKDHSGAGSRRTLSPFETCCTSCMGNCISASGDTWGPTRFQKNQQKKLLASAFPLCQHQGHARLMTHGYVTMWLLLQQASIQSDELGSGFPADC